MQKKAVGRSRELLFSTEGFSSVRAHTCRHTRRIKSWPWTNCGMAAESRREEEEGLQKCEEEKGVELGSTGRSCTRTRKEIGILSCGKNKSATLFGHGEKR